jgi:hypothetical protein
MCLIPPYSLSGREGGGVIGIRHRVEAALLSRDNGGIDAVWVLFDHSSSNDAGPRESRRG